MPNLNLVHIMGNLCRDPEVKYLPKGTAVCTFAIAINSSYKNDAGEKVEKTTFVDIKAWGRTAEVIGEHFTKGKPIFIEGCLEVESWESKTGEKRSKMLVTAQSFQFIGGDAPRERQERPPSRPAQPPVRDLRREPKPPTHNPATDSKIDPDLDPQSDDIPF